MKKPLRILTFTCILAGLSACSSGGSASSVSSIVSFSMTESSLSSLTESSLSSMAESSSDDASLDPYQGRVKPIEFSVVDLMDVPFMGGDERIYDDPKPIADYIRQEKVKMYCLDKTDDVYFADLKTFADLFKDEIAEGYVSNVTDDGNLSCWDVSKGEEIIFRLSMNAKTETLSLIGELDSTFLKSAPYGKTGESDYAQIEYSYLPGHENVERYYPFGDYGFDYFQVDGKYCYPFALLNLGLNQAIERSFIFNTHDKQLFEYGPAQQLQNARFALEGGSSIAASDYLSQSYIKEYDQGESGIAEQPHTLTVFNKNLFYFLMDSFYGLGKQKGITSMSDYLDTFDYSDDFTSDDAIARNYAYCRAVDMFNDLHSAFVPTTLFGTMSNKDYHYDQTFFKDRFELRGYLLGLRKTRLKEYNEAHGTSLKNTDMRYSEDGKYGYFSFDSFDTYNSFDDEEIPEETLLYDTFYLFVRNLTEAKAKGVKRIIIDDTCNLGGYVGIMGKLLALLSKDNKSEMFLRIDGNDAVLKTFTRVDSNHDGKFDASDCFGNDFEFYIITSNFSFSCGNAFPFYADHFGFAKVIGARSGGGECCVFEYAFPNGQSLRYSSPCHVGYWDEEKGVYVGDESGARPVIEAKSGFNEFYDVDSVAASIEASYPSNPS